MSEEKRIYAVITTDGTHESFRLVRASSHAKATAHVMSVVTTRVATQIDLERAIGPDAAVKIEEATP